MHSDANAVHLYSTLSSWSGMTFILSRVSRRGTLCNIVLFWLGIFTTMFCLRNRIERRTGISTLLFSVLYTFFTRMYEKKERCGVLEVFSCSLRNIVSTGEWHSFSIFFAIFFSDYIARYVLEIFPPLQEHMMVSHAGLVGCIIGCLLSFFGKGVVLSALQKTVLIALVALGIVDFTLQRINHDDTLRDNGSSQILFYKWIAGFLLSSDGDGQKSAMSSTLPNFFCLIYWSLILLLCALPSIHLSHQAMISRATAKITIYRKFFHFVATILFLPTTITHPKMMALSYSIGVALLIVLESVRQNVPHGAINKFYDSFRDEKDENDFVITHVGLVLGCAIPQWIHQSTHSSSALLPLIGILVLGVGDAFGAVVGTCYGRRTIFGKKTLEGSLGMFFGMVFFAVLGKVCFNAGEDVEIPWVVFGFLTLMEASTTQIDNFSLPVMG